MRTLLLYVQKGWLKKRFLGILKRVTVTPAVYSHFLEFLHVGIQSTGRTLSRPWSRQQNDVMSEIECAQLNSELFRCRHSTRQSHGLFALAKHLSYKHARDTIFGDFRNDDICACTVSILILLPVVNISPKMDSATSVYFIVFYSFTAVNMCDWHVYNKLTYLLTFLMWHGNFSHPTLFLAYFSKFSLRMRSFDHITTSGLKSCVIFEFSAPVFVYRRGHFGCATPFSVTFVKIMSTHVQ